MGRDTSMRQMTDEVGRATVGKWMPLIGIDGPAGIGKTALAVAWAHDIADRYPDGTLFANLRGHDPSNKPADPADVLQDFLFALGMPPEAVPGHLEARAASLRTMLRNQRVLLVLDNAVDSDQVRPLLPSSSGCLVVVTSRTRLGGLCARDGAVRLTLAPLSDAEGVALLTLVVGRRVTDDQEAAHELARQCGGLPLALRIAAERVTNHEHLALPRLTGIMSSRSRRLDALSAGGDESTTIRAVFSWSYVAQPAEAACLFRMLSLHPGPTFGLDAAAALAGATTQQTQRWLDRLVDAHLLEQPDLGRYSFHDLIRLYASERAEIEESEGDRRAALGRVLDWYLHTAAAAMHSLSPQREPIILDDPVTGVTPITFDDIDAASTWCEDELKNLAVVTRVAAEQGFVQVATAMPAVLCDYFYRRKPWSLWTRAHMLSLDVARRQGHAARQGWILNNLGNAHIDLGQPRTAIRFYDEALRVRRSIDDRSGQAWSRVGLGRCYAALTEPRHAAHHFARAMHGFADLGDRWGWAIALSYLGDTCRLLGQHRTAIDYHHQAVEVLRELGDRQAEGCSLEKLGAVYSDLEDWPSAIESLHHAGTILGEIGDRWGYAQTMTTLGDLQQRKGSPDLASAAWQDAANAFEELQDPRASTVRGKLERLREEQVSIPGGG
ncbi:transcriptional regulator, SARP family [Actinokineospora spheciospongiae]|uniref:Transcriptional regulator, SARP family n=2 Tax=Actinokineospora spheciospongiae TaxID=909613 RepID=W7J673_9PSEU|nr:transcriptional regulator, SARP family [Actinokineospora spheciospongiae]